MAIIINSLKKQPLSKRGEVYLLEITEQADRTRNYKKAIKIFEAFKKKHVFNAELKHELGMLYDHYAIQLRGAKLLQTKTKQEIDHRKAKEMFTKAEMLYTEIIHEKKNKKIIPLAFHGLARIKSELGNHKKAIDYELRAYTYMHKLPKIQRTVLGVGNIYLITGKIKIAEKWFLKELHVFGKNNIGAVANMLIFYEITKKTKKALPYAILLETLLKKEKRFKENKHGKKDSTIEILLQRIQSIKNAQTSE